MATHPCLGHSSAGPMSVNDRGVNMDGGFPVFLRARLTHHPVLLLRKHGLSGRPYHQPTMTAYHGSPAVGYDQVLYGNDDFRRRSSVDSQQHLSPHLFPHLTAPAFLPLFRPEPLIPQHKYDGHVPMFQQAMHASAVPQYHQFRMVDSPPPTFDEVPPSLKLDTNPLLPTPSVMSENVDTSKYESVPYEEWIHGTPEYSGSSPTDTESGDSHTSFGRTSSAGFVFTPDTLNAAVAELEELEDPYLKNPYCPRLSATDQESSVPHRLMSTTDVQSPFERAESLSSGADSEHSDEDDAESERSTPASNSASDDVDQLDDGHSRNRLLLDMRDRGISYKDIKRLGKFSEAESTLRGRVRMLTKQKHERVRRPQWTTQDVRWWYRKGLLCNCADKCSSAFSSVAASGILPARQVLMGVPKAESCRGRRYQSGCKSMAAATCLLPPPVRRNMMS